MFERLRSKGGSATGAVALVAGLLTGPGTVVVGEMVSAVVVAEHVKDATPGSYASTLTEVTMTDRR